MFQTEKYNRDVEAKYEVWVWQEMKLVCFRPQGLLCVMLEDLAYRNWGANEEIKADNLIF